MKNHSIFMILCSILFMACGKEFLDIKPEKSLAVPEKLKDLRAMLDNTSIMNINSPFLGEVSSGDYDPIPARFQGLQAKERNSLIWAKDIFEIQFAEDWDWSYRRIYYANRVLEGLEEIEPAESELEEFENIKGSAYFFRSWAYFQLAQLFCKQYDPQTSAIDPGLPIRMESNITLLSKRASVKATYEQVLADAEQSVIFLPEQSLYPSRPTKHAAYALLALIYLQMEDYTRALEYADRCLKLDSRLMDYNTLNVKANFPISRFNPEVIFHSLILFGNSFINTNMSVNNSLYQMYSDNDIRKTAFYALNGTVINYKGSYNGTREYFNGFSNNEIYLIAAECYARKDEPTKAVQLLNTLREMRWKKNSYQLLTAQSSEQALRLVLEERRRELCFRGRRWWDLRRLNKDSRFALTLSRTINNVSYTLPPNDLRYVLPLPPQVIELTDMEQNPR